MEANNQSTSTNSLEKKEVAAVLEQLHQRAKQDYKSFLTISPKVLWSLLTGKKLMSAVTPTMLKDAYIPVSAEQGLFLYSIARGSKAQTIVEFGSSFGVSTVYLAAAAKDNGGRLITTEIIPEKCRVTEQNLHSAELSQVVDVLEGDALVTLKNIEGTVDLIFLDGWKDLYNDVLDVLLGNMKPGTIVIADNINMADAQKYLARVKAKNSGFITSMLDKRTAFSVYVGT